MLLQAKNVQDYAESVEQPQAEKPPYSYMALIQFAINSKKNKQMTLKEIYTWIEDRFPYFKKVAKPGWKVLLSRQDEYFLVHIPTFILFSFMPVELHPP